MRFSIVGAGYVGLSLATLISRICPVTLVDIIDEKVTMINRKISPIKDDNIQEILESPNINLTATTNIEMINGSDYIIIATPTNYSIINNKFDTTSVEETLRYIEKNSPQSMCIIKSTIPIGFTENFCKVNKYSNIIFSPEFLREGKAAYDNLYPARIIIGIPKNCTKLNEAKVFANILKECANNDPPVLYMGSNEAESVKLFSNTYLAMRIAFFNELDTFTELNNLDTKKIIEGVCTDMRIGNYYNNPSFGYGGYCLPKDTKQLSSEYINIPNSLIKAIAESNDIRKEYITSRIIDKLKTRHGTIGIYRLIMKSGSDNFRGSSIIDIIEKLSDKGYKILIYEPNLCNQYNNYPIENDINKFAQNSDIIVCNRYSYELKQFSNKVYCRDIFNND